MAKTETTTKKAPAPKTADVIKLVDWLHGTARARGDVADTLKKAKETLKKNASDKSIREFFGKHGDNGKTILARYEKFAQRGSQAGKRSRKAA